MKRTGLSERVKPPNKPSNGDIPEGKLVTEEEGPGVAGEERLQLLDAGEERGRAGGVAFDGQDGDFGPDELVEPLCCFQVQDVTG